MTKSDEKSKPTPLVIEMPSCEDSFTAEKVLHYFGARPRGPGCGGLLYVVASALLVLALQYTLQ